MAAMKVQGGRKEPIANKAAFKAASDQIKGLPANFVRAESILRTSGDPSLIAVAADMDKIAQQILAVQQRLGLLNRFNRYR
jgi:hypothetical protein